MKEIVIKIDNTVYNGIVNTDEFLPYDTFEHLLEAVKNGTELPKGHKELIDTKELIQGFVKAAENMKGNGVTPVFDVHEIINMVLSQKVIVDADKGEE